MRFARSRRAQAATLLAFALVCALWPMLARPVHAHASLVRANPANNETLRRAPARVALNFSEPLERGLTKIEVADKDGNRFDDGPIAYDDKDNAFASVGVKTLEPGLYFVNWSNVSTVDGHPYKGSYPFIVLNLDGTFPAGVSFADAETTTSGELLPKNVDIALKWLGLLSLATVAGAAFFLVAVLRPAARFLEDEDFHRATEAGERWLVNLAHVLLPASFLATAFLVQLTWSRFDTSTGIFDYLLQIRTGQYRAVQMLLIALALIGGDVLFLGSTEGRRRIGVGLLLISSVGALLSYSMVSHAATGKGEFWAVGSDFLHLAASSTWLGALVMLWPLLRWSPGAPEPEQRYLFLANAADRFSIVAGLSVMVVFATGTFNGLVAIPDQASLFDTTYGKVLLAKLALIVPLLAIAGLNAFVLKPRFVATIDALYQQGGSVDEVARDGNTGVLARLRTGLIRTVAAEVVVVLAVFAAVSVLSQTSTAKGENAQYDAANAKARTFSQQADAGGVKMLLEVMPNRVGLNEYSVSVTSSDGRPVEAVTQVRLRFSYDDVQDAVAPSEIILTKFASGEYRGAGAYFSQPGNWRTEASIRRSDGDDLSKIFVVPVARQEAKASEKSDDTFALPFAVFTWNEILGAMLALVGAAIIIYRKQLRWLQEPGYRIGITFATALLLSGAVLAFGVDTDAKGNGNLTAGNSLASTKESVERGKLMFQNNCISCHGIDGRGDGPDGVGLSPAPTDFRLHTPLHDDPQFFGFIANGYPGSAMPKFRAAFSDDDIWNLVNYLRSAFTEAPAQ